jgi:hypothetical protein
MQPTSATLPSIAPAVPDSGVLCRVTFPGSVGGDAVRLDGSVGGHWPTGAVAFFRRYVVERRPEWFAPEEGPQAGALPQGANVLCRVVGPGWVAALGVTTEGRVARFWPTGALGRFAETTLARLPRLFERVAGDVEVERPEPAPPTVARELPPAASAAIAPAAAAHTPPVAARPSWLRCRVAGGRTVNCEGWSLDDRLAHHWAPGTVAYFAEPTVRELSGVLVPEPVPEAEVPKAPSTSAPAPVERRASPAPRMVGEPAEPAPSDVSECEPSAEPGTTSAAPAEPAARLWEDGGGADADKLPDTRNAASEPPPSTATPAAAQQLAGEASAAAAAHCAEGESSGGADDEDMRLPRDAPGPSAQARAGPRPPDRPTLPRVQQRGARKGPDCSGALAPTRRPARILLT